MEGLIFVGLLSGTREMAWPWWWVGFLMVLCALVGFHMYRRRGAERALGLGRVLTPAVTWPDHARLGVGAGLRWWDVPRRSALFGGLSEAQLNRIELCLVGAEMCHSTSCCSGSTDAGKNGDGQRCGCCSLAPPRSAYTNLETDICIVCMAHFSTGQKIRVLPCAHIYHRDCIDPWLRRSSLCPLCRICAAPA
mmetsp:Transcript_17028/g.37010  ORF Transcript_17028/g.37010 Transcript_17028/m.37010 type:complete len:193 (+) Transcript_17028:250-828(+)